MLKVGIVGVGGISGTHIPAWKQIPEAQLVALCDIRPEQMERYQNENVHIYTSFEEMLANEQLDILDICLPTYLHADYAVRAMECGIHVLCEKPISLNREDVTRVYETAERNGVTFMVAHVVRFWNEYVFLKDCIDSKRYGNVVNGHLERMGNTPRWSWDDWMADPERSGLVPFDLHIHDLDWLIYALGAPKDITARRVRSGRSDYMNGVYHYDNFFVTTDAAWFDNGFKFGCAFRFMFEHAVVEFKNRVLTVYENSGKTFVVDAEVAEGEAVINLPKTNAYYEEIRYFTDCVLANKPTDKIKPEELLCGLDILKAYQ